MDNASAKKAFLYHLAAFAVVNAAFFTLNAMQTPPEGAAREWWAVWPLVGWGVGVAAHGLALVLRGRGNEGGLLADRGMRGIIVHAFVYVAVNLILIAVNLLETPNTIWFIWPLLGWGAGLAAHAWLAYQGVMRRTLQRYADEQRVLAEMERERMAAEAIAAAQARELEEAEAAKAKAAAKKKPARKRSTTASKSRSAAAKKAPAKKPAAKARAKSSGAKSSSAKKPPAKRTSCTASSRSRRGAGKSASK